MDRHHAIALRAALAAVLMLSATTVHAQTPPARDGKSILEVNCARCHAVGGSGASPLEKAPPMRDVARKYRPENLAESLAEGIVTGHADMPQFIFQPDEIAAIIGYLNALRDAK